MSRKNKLAFNLQFSVFSLVFFCVSSAHAAKLDMPKEPIVVNGDKVEYFHDKKEVVGTDNISITYKDVILTCDKITVHLDTRDAVAEGHVKVSQKGAYFTGDRINYNFDTRKGTVLNGYVNAKPFYGKAQEVGKLANKDQINLERGYVTTCNLEKPHYRVQSRQVRIYLNDKVVAKHILFFVGNVPIVYIPYYVQPLKERKSHITVIPGQSKDWGYYVLASYRYYIGDKNRGDLLLDYRSKKGLAYGVNHYYDTGKAGDISFKYYQTRENDNLAYEKTDEEKTRYRYQARYRWDMGDQTDTTAILEFNKLSDQDIIRDYFYNEYVELGEPDTYLTFITTKKDYSTQLLVRKRFDNFYTVVERLPEYRIDIPNFKVGNTPVYYTGSASGVYLNKTFARSDETPGDINAVRFDVYNQLAYAARLFKSLSVTPYGGIRNTYYSRNKWGDTNPIRTIFSAGVDNSMKFYRMYDVNTDFMGLDLNKLRHVITPTANYYFTYQPSISPDNLNQFDEIDALDTANGVKLALENRLQTKRMSGDQMKSVDLLTFIVSTDYQFRLERDFWGLKRNKFNGVDFLLELMPYSWAYIQSQWTVNTKKSQIDKASVDLVANGGEKWQLAISDRFENTSTDYSNLIALDGIYKINEQWKLRAYARYSASKGAFEEQEYTVSKDLHCWIADFTVTIRDQQNLTFWIIMKLKAFPDYPIGLRQVYSRPRFGAAGER